MKSFKVWAPAVSFSLLYHLVLILIIAKQFSATHDEKFPLQSITVELAGNAPVISSQPRIQQVKQTAMVKLIIEPIKKEDVPVVNDVPEALQKTTEISAHNTAITTENIQSNLDVKKTSELTRHPKPLTEFDKDSYPDFERRAGITAKGGLCRLIIDKQGNVVKVTIIKSLGANFDAAYTAAIFKVKFSPAYINEEAVAAPVLVPFSFKIK